MKLFTIITTVLPLLVVARPSGVYPSHDRSRSPSPGGSQPRENSGVLDQNGGLTLAEMNLHPDGKPDKSEYSMSHESYFKREFRRRRPENYDPNLVHEGVRNVPGLNPPHAISHFSGTNHFVSEGSPPAGQGADTEDGAREPSSPGPSSQTELVQLKRADMGLPLAQSPGDLAADYGPPSDHQTGDRKVQERLNTMSGLWWKRLSQAKNPNIGGRRLLTAMRRLNATKANYNMYAEDHGFPKITVAVTIKNRFDFEEQLTVR